ncbi:MAG: TetR/AcrR family transcriptional regulator C-terminal domain-containing protein [Acidimicrobiales bacterium]|nr:TetR/AcrR family transcriptional regulator C-terminal domain-containing protein [Acidimicrobiales bacterium]
MSAHRLLMTHPWAATEWNRTVPGPARTGYMESILRALTDWRLDEDLVYRGYHAVTMHIVGFITQELGYRQPVGGMSLLQAASAFLEQMDDAELPHLAAHIQGHLDGDHGDEFGFVLDLILDGLAATQAAR